MVENNVTNKYRLTNETKEIDEHVLYRIEALRDFRDVKTGDLAASSRISSNYQKTVIVGCMMTPVCSMSHV